MERAQPGPRQADLSGTTWDGIEFVALHGAGGFGQVYRAHWVEDGRRLAVKVAHSDRRLSASLVRRFRTEAESLARLEHPGIVDMVGFGQVDDGRPYIAMSWIDGPNLDDELRRQHTFTIEQAIAIIAQLGDALAAAHSIGVIHRDVKPSNILLSPRPVLVDFGLAKLSSAESDLGLTTAGTCLGTPLTMSPEQILGEPIDERTDVYSLAVVAYRMLAGEYPYRGEIALEIQELHVNGEIPRISQTRPELPPALDALFEAALAKRTRDRIASPQALAQGLQTALATSSASV